MSRCILIVDDQTDLLPILVKSLMTFDRDYEIHIANSGSEALAKMADRPFDLVVTDLQMPGMDGLTLMERIRECYPTTHLILMSFYLSPQARRTAYQLGGDVLDKPFRAQALREMVEATLS